MVDQQNTPAQALEQHLAETEKKLFEVDLEYQRLLRMKTVLTDVKKSMEGKTDSDSTESIPPYCAQPCSMIASLTVDLAAWQAVAASMGCSC